MTELASQEGGGGASSSITAAILASIMVPCAMVCICCCFWKSVSSSSRTMSGGGGYGGGGGFQGGGGGSYYGQHDDEDDDDGGPQGDAPVSDPRGALDALKAEYVEGREGSVGEYLDSGVPDRDASVIETYEDRLRNASNREAEIERIRNEWGIRRTRGLKLDALTSSKSAAVSAAPAQAFARYSPLQPAAPAMTYQQAPAMTYQRPQPLSTMVSPMVTYAPNVASPVTYQTSPPTYVVPASPFTAQYPGP
eukprot:TRINITY_DN2809_c0_g1_i1.p1 TRINITY_DN2809_c0_g1~~TRINITY_DN2809_c0_g1_i1.p1  ORF type:complete len:251 (+),score=43.68 TRINITY_DN2809_c0_g1_i1:212-964(+)